MSTPNENDDDSINPANIYPSCVLVPAAVTATVSSLQVQLNTVYSDGTGGEYLSMGGAEIMLGSPGGAQLELLGAVGDGYEEGGSYPTQGDCQSTPAVGTLPTGTCGLQGLNILIGTGSGFSTAPFGNTPLPQTGTAKYLATSLAGGCGNCIDSGGPGAYPDITTTLSNFPPQEGSATLPGTFDGVSAAGLWKLYMINVDGDPVEIHGGWNLTLNLNVSQTSTTTTISSSGPGVPGGSITLTATVKAGTTPVTAGTVSFFATINGSNTAITCSGGNQALNSSGQATCIITLAGAGSASQCSSSASPQVLPAWSTAVCQGSYTLGADYLGSGSFSSSSTTFDQLVEETASTPTQTGVANEWCNNNAFGIPADTAAPFAYPSTIKIPTGTYPAGYVSGQTVSNVSVTLKNLVGGSEGIGGQFLLVAPGGGAQNLDFMDTTFETTNTDDSGSLVFEDSASGYAPDSGTPGGPYEATDDNNNANPDVFPSAGGQDAGDSSIPALPGTINFAKPYDPDPVLGYTHTGIYTFGQAFNGASAAGTWALYTAFQQPMSVEGGWCITLTPNAAGAAATTTTVTSNPQIAATSQGVVFTATVKSGGNAVTSGTVTFTDETAGTTLQSNVALNGSGQAVTNSISFSTEGDHQILAAYNGSSSFSSSNSSTYWERINNATAVTVVSADQFQFCNSGPVQIAAQSTGPFTPNPSVISVSGLPGTFSTASVTLNSFSVSDQFYLFKLASLLENSSTGAALDFFSNTAQDSGDGESTATLGNYTFEDGQTRVPSTASAIGPGTSGGTVLYGPTAYPINGGSDGTPDTFTSSSSGFYNVPGTINYAATNGSKTFGDTFVGGSNANGNWLLFFNEANTAGETLGAAGGWCLNVTVTAPTVSVGLSNASTVVQGQQDVDFTVSIDNGGSTGPTGDPTGGSDPMTVSFALPAALSFDNTGAGTFGSNWSCSASGQNVSCTNDSSVAQDESYPELTIPVNVGGTATGTLNNLYVTASGAGVASTTSPTTGDSVTIDVPPAFTSANNTTMTVGTSSPFTFTTTGTPTATLSESGGLPSGIGFTAKSGGSATLTGTPAAGTGGVYDLIITAANGTTNTAQDFTLTVDQAPSISSANSTTFAVGSSGSFTVTSATGTYPAATFSTAGPLPSGVTLSSAGLLSGTPAAGTGGTYTITISASNGIGSPGTQSFTLTVDQAPSITSISSTTFTVGSPGSFTVTSASGTNPTATFSVTGGSLPSGVTLAGSGLLSGTPAAGTGGVYNFTITASNGVSPDATQSFTLTVDQAPSITSASSTTFTVGTNGSFTVTSATGTYPAATFSVFSGNLPTGVTLSNSGSLSGTPAAGTGGTYTVTITASNGVGSPSEQTFTLTVDQPPSITSGSSATFTVGSFGSFSVTTAAGTYPTATTFSETGTLPTGVTFNGSTGVLSGTLAAGTGGVYNNITIFATNGVSPSAQQSFTLTVDQAPSITSASSTTFTVGTLGSFTVTSASGTYPAAVFSKTGGTLPNGVTLSGSGVLSGIPSAGTGGTYTVFVSASNGVGSPSTQTFTLTVDEAPAITSASSALFTGGVANTFTVTTTGYPTPALSDNGATLPTGVTFTDNGNGSATLSGNPSTYSTYPITITASNGVSPNASQSFTLTTIPPQAIVTTAANPIGGGFVTPQSGTSYNQGSSVPLQATPATGYTFLNWTSSPDQVASPTSASTTIIANSNETVTGNFMANLVVTTPNDDAGNAGLCTPQATPGTGTDSACSLRDALLFAANAGSGSITFDSTAFGSAQTIALGSAGTLTIPANTTIAGPTSGTGYGLANLVTVDGASTYQIFISTGTATVTNLTIQNGNNAGGGAAIHHSGGTLTLANCSILNNAASTGNSGAGFGGAVQGPGPLVVSNCTFSGNTAGANGGAIYQSSGTLNITNSTFYNNSSNEAGAIFNNASPAVIANSTFSGNSSIDYAGLIENYGALTFTDNVAANNMSGAGGAILNSDGSGATLNANYNIYFNNMNSTPADVDVSCSSGTCTSPTTVDTNFVEAASNPVAALGSYGGPTQTMVPLPGGGAICAVPKSLVPSGTLTDQRGFGFDPLCKSGSIDAGADQSSYVLVGFSTQPPAATPPTVAMSPAPAVSVTESGAPAVGGTVSIAGSTWPIGGTTTAAVAAGTATFSNLIPTDLTTGEKLIATLPLNPSLTPPLNLTATSDGIHVTRDTQTITFPAITGTQYIDSTVPLAATASSGLAVTFVSLTPATCTVSDTSGWSASLAAVGNCTVEAQQTGGGEYAPAPNVQQTVFVQLVPQTITFTPIANTQVVNGSVPLAATATSGQAVSFVSYTPATCTVADTSGWTASFIAAGSCTLVATQAGGGQYAAAPNVQQILFVHHVSQTISFPAITNDQVVQTSIPLSATATSGLAVSFASTTPATCTVSNASGWSASFIASGSCTLLAIQSGNSVYAAASDVSQNIFVHHLTQTISFPAITNDQVIDTSIPLTATATSGLAVSFASDTPSTCTVSDASGWSASLIAAGSCTLVATQSGNSIYGSAPSVSQVIYVHHLTQTISFTAIPNTQTAQSTLPLSATSTSGLTVNFTSTTPATCTVSGTTASFNSYGDCTIEASQPGNSVYGAAPNVSQTVFVHHLTQTISFGPIASQTVGTPLALSATASSGLTVGFQSTTPGICTVSGTTASFSAAGTCIIQATQAGSGVYSAAPAVSQSFSVTN
jgi:hypothetical protein